MSGLTVLSMPEQKMLTLLRRAEVQDRPVAVGRKTRYTDAAITVNRQVAEHLVEMGFARFSRPAGRFLLITAAGRDREAA